MGGGMPYFVLLILFTYSYTLASSENLPQPDNGNALGAKDIFILAGQSNMAGRGYMGNGLPPECRPDPRILRLSAQKKWEEAKEPLHQDIDVKKKCGVGPGLAFANSVLKSDQSNRIGVIGLVPCAIGGTSITQWQRGGFLYNQLVERARAASSDAGIIRAVLWYQGEADANSTMSDAEKYKERLEMFLKDVRSDLGLHLPIIQVALASGGNPTYTEIVRKAQLGITLENVTTVDAKGLELQSDHLHLTTEAQVKLGKMLATAALPILKNI